MSLLADLSPSLAEGTMLVLTTLSMLLCALAISSYMMWWIFPKRWVSFFARQGISGPPLRPFYGHSEELRQIQEHSEDANNDAPVILPALRKWRDTYGDVFVYFLGPFPKIVITDPNLIKQLMIHHQANYSKTRNVHLKLSFLGEGLFTANADKWDYQRTMLNPMFSHGHLKRMQAQMVEVTQEAISHLHHEVRAKKGPIERDMFAELANLTLTVACRTLFGVGSRDVRELATAYVIQERFKVVQHESLDTRLYSRGLFIGYNLLPLPKHLKLCCERWRMQSLAKSLIRKRALQKQKEKKGEEDDLLNCLLSAGSSGQHFMNKEITDNTLTFLFAGHETSAELVAWTMYLLAKHKNWAEKARAEVASVCGDSPLAWGDITKLKTVSAVLNEAMRLYPPMTIIERECIQEHKLGPYVIPRNVDVVIPLFLLHSAKKTWGEDALKFRPNRFEEMFAVRRPHSSVFIPFGVGRRSCIGQNFAMLEAKTILVAFLQNFRWRMSPSYRHSPQLINSLLPQHGMPMILELDKIKKSS